MEEEAIKKPRKKLGTEKVSHLKAEYNCSYIKMSGLLVDKMKWLADEANDTQAATRFTWMEFDGDDVCICLLSCEPAERGVLKLFKIIRKANKFDVVTYSCKEKSYLYFTHHFFIRYRKRLKLIDKSILELVKHFAEHGSDFKYEQVTADEQDSIKAVIDEALLYCDKRTWNLTTFKTIIPKDLLNRKQAAMFNALL